MDFEVERDGLIKASGREPRLKTSLRLKYEAEVRAFKTRYLSIENVRKSLGFSQRKMCQMLMVDPSAWSRWMKDEDKIPPHIYRALEWLLLSQEKNPDLLRVMSAGLMSSSGGQTGELKSISLRLGEKIEALEGELEALKRSNMAGISKFMILLVGLFALALMIILIR